MEEPRFRYLCSYRASFTEPQQMIGKAHFGRRMIAALTGGEVEGERLHGRVMPSGGDWATIDDNDTLRLDARITMETHDGALIYVSYRGVLRPLSAAPNMRGTAARGRRRKGPKSISAPPRCSRPGTSAIYGSTTSSPSGSAPASAARYATMCSSCFRRVRSPANWIRGSA